MKSRTYSISSITLFLFILTVTPAHAQFGGLLKKAKDKAKQGNVSTATNTETPSATGNTSGANASPNRNRQASGEGLRWDSALKNPNFTGSVNEGAMTRNNLFFFEPLW